VIVGLCSSFREGRLVRGAVESLAEGCEVVLVLEGPAPHDREPLGKESELRGLPANVIVRRESHDDDAAKRTALVQWAQALHKRRSYHHSRSPLWLVWCDADEILLWSRYLPDYLEHLEQSSDAYANENATGGFGLRHVEPDGSVHLSTGRVLNGHTAFRYLVSGYQLELDSGMIVALPLLPLCSAGGIPLSPNSVQLTQLTPETQDEWLAQHRPPLDGEPHTLHRHPLRSKPRARQRMHVDEAQWFERTHGEK
jgi:hypothetical protein